MIEMRWIKIPHGGDTKNALSISLMGMFSSENFQLQYREWPQGTQPGYVAPDWTDVKIESP